MFTCKPGCSATNETADDLSAFLTTYDCVVAALIAHIHAYPHPERMNRYLVLENAASREYVQCLFFDRDRLMLCEAMSGWWEQKGSGPNFKSYLAPARLAALARLGFSMDASHGNFQRRFRFGSTPPDYTEIADLMLTALYTGYDARLATGIVGEGPYAMRKGLLPQDRCIPVS